MRFSSLSSVAVAALVVAACSSSSSNDVHGGNGVDDVGKACAIRTGWTKFLSSACGTCTGEVTAPKCPCSDYPTAGACSMQQSAFNAQAACDGVLACVTNCKQGDCTCVSGCYTGKEACLPFGGAVDGCVAEQCDAACR